MNWFRHDTAASRNKKVRQLIRRHRELGYAVYFFCLERINEQIKENRLTFDLDYTAEDIVDGLCIEPTPTALAVDRVNQVMRSMIELNLFQEHKGVIYCFQSAEQITTGQIKNPQMKDIQVKIQARISSNSMLFLEDLGRLAGKSSREPEKQQTDAPQGNSESSRKIVEDPGISSPDYIRLDQNNTNTARGENSEPVDNSGDNVDNSPRSQSSEHQITKAEIQQLIDAWNSSGSLIPFRGTIGTLKAKDAIREHCKLYTQAERLQAVYNLDRIKADPVAFGNLWPDYLDPESFLRGGVAKYVDEAKPFERCMTKGRPSAGVKAQPAKKPLYCPHCGSQKGAASYCPNRDCVSNGPNGKDPIWTEVKP